MSPGAFPVQRMKKLWFAKLCREGFIKLKRMIFFCIREVIYVAKQPENENKLQK